MWTEAERAEHVTILKPFSRIWSPYFDITELKTTVNEGVVTFRGTVANPRILDLARAIAIDAGARDVVSTDVTIK